MSERSKAERISFDLALVTCRLGARGAGPTVSFYGRVSAAPLAALARLFFLASSIGSRFEAPSKKEKRRELLGEAARRFPEGE